MVEHGNQECHFLRQADLNANVHLSLISWVTLAKLPQFPVKWDSKSSYLKGLLWGLETMVPVMYLPSIVPYTVSTEEIIAIINTVISSSVSELKNIIKNLHVFMWIDGNHDC